LAGVFLAAVFLPEAFLAFLAGLADAFLAVRFTVFLAGALTNFLPAGRFVFPGLAFKGFLALLPDAAFLTGFFFFAAVLADVFFAEVLGLRMVSPLQTWWKTRRVTLNETTIVSGKTLARCFRGMVL
jgi:hypothetical protein